MDAEAASTLGTRLANLTGKLRDEANQGRLLARCGTQLGSRLSR
jgi:hypothetical protein